MSKAQDEHDRFVEMLRAIPGCREITEATETTVIFRSPRAEADEAEDPIETDQERHD